MKEETKDKLMLMGMLAIIVGIFTFIVFDFTNNTKECDNEKGGTCNQYEIRDYMHNNEN